jgi:hypothetical protein
MSNVPRPPTPGKSCCLALPTSRMLHSAQTIASAFPFSVFRGSTPSATAFGPFACLSTLKDSGYPLPIPFLNFSNNPSRIKAFRATNFAFLFALRLNLSLQYFLINTSNSFLFSSAKNFSR